MRWREPRCHPANVRWAPSPAYWVVPYSCGCCAGASSILQCEAGVVRFSMPDEFEFSDEERRGVYRAIYERRDVRSHFLPDPVPREVLSRILDAAHHAPSVGFMQPWDFIVIRDPSVREEIYR